LLGAFKAIVSANTLVSGMYARSYCQRGADSGPGI
jgi:hypothetical protein